ncbi:MULTISPECIES: hypothetical protein [Streptomyces]|uniref:hypothetical protein n=1 Tax=Streptomyces TaxID=1883 RepID=UPI0019BA8E98|nr:hypothetical protein [Streptomyces sp. WAC06128]GGY58449.1 hypothetical protein GCM10010385_04570 [Streptomyces geysiriensis]
MTWVTVDSTASTANATSPAEGGAANPPGGARRRRGRPGRRPARAVAVAVGLVGALALTACTDGGDSDDGGSGGSGGDKASAAPSASASAETGGTTGGSPSAAGELEGSWLATADGQAVALMVTGDKAALFATGGTVCSGTAGDVSGTRTIRLKCTAGGDDRATGTVESVDDTTLRVTWEGGVGEETYTRSEGGSLPPGLPTEGLGS